MSAQLAIQIVMSTLGAMMLAIIWSLRRSAVPGVRQWWQGNIAVALSLMLFGLRGQASDLLSIVAANALLLWGTAQFYAGLLVFCERRPHWRALACAIAVVMAGVMFWRYGTDDFNLRVMLVSGLQAALSLHAGVVLLRERQRNAPSQYAAALFALFFGTAYALRAILSANAALGSAHGAEAPGLHIGFMLLGPLAMPAMTMCTVLMIHDRLVRRLEDAANTDFLTGALSRQAFEREAGHQLSVARRGGPLCLLMIDIDHFKRVNDNFGHAAGDTVLQRFARLARAQTRPSDRVGRLGGEEFAVLLPGTRASEAGHIAERIRAHAEADCASGACGEIRFTISTGLAAWKPGESLAELAARADAALYHAKRQGRNRIHTALDAAPEPAVRG